MAFTPKCATEKKAFLISSLSVFLGGLAIILLWRALQLYFAKWTKTVEVNIVETIQWYPGMRKKKKILYSLRIQVVRLVEMLLSAQTPIGKILVILVFLLNIGTVIVYCIMSTYPVNSCEYSGYMTTAVDLMFNLFFAFYFGLRFIAAHDKLKFWLEITSIVDFFTIPPTGASVFIGGNWLGLRFLRALRLLELPKILLMLKVTKTSAVIKLSKLLAVFLSTWLTSAGFLLLLENTGDPWLNYKNCQRLNYFECIYMLMVTMSTVGYGDITAATTLGRIFIIFFIVGGLALFASLTPEIVEIVGSHKKYNGSHIIVGGRKHIVVCGHVTLESVTAFVNEFSIRDRAEISTEVLFMEEIKPTLELEAVFKCHHMETTFFHGSVLNHNDLKRVKMECADACLVLANKHSSNPQHEDESNIMRVISIKHYYPQTRVIIQILQSHNKVHLQNIPSWNWRIGDSINCLDELKLGFMAQSCLVPGLSTVLINLCSMNDTTLVDRRNWKRHFLDGASNSFITCVLSNDFVGMPFIEVCRLCYVKMNIVLIAIEIRSETGIRSSVYCKECHATVYNPLLIKKCSCKKSVFTSPEQSLICLEKSRSLGVLSVTEIRQPTKEADGNNSLDSTGMFHWCKEVPLEKAILMTQCVINTLHHIFYTTTSVGHQKSHRKAAQMNFQNHIIVSVFGDVNSTLIGLRDFVMPLRTSNLMYDELKPIVFLGQLDYLTREWKSIQYFPELFIFPGSGLSRANLRSVNIHKCSMCAVLSSILISNTSQYMEDTECILATLNLRSMTPKNPSSIAASLPAPDLNAHSPRIPVITELKQASNVTFINEDISTNSQYAETNPYLTAAFASGSVFSEDFLDSLMSMTYFNWQVLGLLQIMVTGGTTPELEEQLAEQNALRKSSVSNGHMAPQDRCKLSLIPLTDHRLAYTKGITYGELFCTALTSFCIICFGIYRLMDVTNQHLRYVITRPPKNFPLLDTDLLYCVVPSTEELHIHYGGSRNRLPQSLSQNTIKTKLEF